MPVGTTLNAVLKPDGSTVGAEDDHCAIPTVGTHGTVSCLLVNAALASGQSEVWKVRVNVVSGQTVTPVVNEVTAYMDQFFGLGSQPTDDHVTECSASCLAAPTLTLTGPATVDEDSSTARQYSYTATHPNGTPTVTPSCGPGGTLGAHDVGAQTFLCTFADGPRTSEVSLTGVQGVARATKKLAVTVDNVPPKATLTVAGTETWTAGVEVLPAPDITVPEDTPFTLRLTDPVDPSNPDRDHGFWYAFDCGTGYGDTLLWKHTADVFANVSFSCPGLPAGTRTVKALIRDQDGPDVVYASKVRVGTGAVLVVEKTADKSQALRGEQITYTVTVRNDGPQEATNLVVTDTWAAGLKFVSVSVADGDFDCVPQGPADAETGVQCTLASLAVADGGTPTVSFTLVLAVANDASGTLTNTATADSAEQNPGDPSDTADVTVVDAAAALVVDKTADKTQALRGEQVTYTVKVRNDGPQAATNLAVTDTWPVGLEFDSFQEGDFDSCQTTTTDSVVTGLSCELASLVKAVDGAPMPQFTLTLSVAADATGTLTNTATAASDEANPGDSSDTADVTVVSAGQVTLTGDGGFASETVGATSAPRTFTVTNTGGQPVTLESITRSGDFAIAGGTCAANLVLAPAESCTILVNFSPTAEGARTGTLAVATSGNDPEAALTGTGRAGNVLPTLAIALECMTQAEIDAYVTANPAVVAGAPQVGTSTCTAATDVPRTNDWLRARVVSATDPDDDPDGLKFEYEWRINQVLQRATSTPTSARIDVYRLDLEAAGDLDNVIVVSARAHDGKGSGAVARDRDQVANTVPTARTVYVSIAAGVTSKTITLRGTDPDFQSLRYAVTPPGTGTLKFDGVPLSATTDLGYANELVFEPPNGLTGTVQFSYEVTDTRPGSTHTGSVHVGAIVYGQATTGLNGEMTAGPTSEVQPVTTGVSTVNPALDIEVRGAQISVAPNDSDYAALAAQGYAGVDVEADLDITVDDGGGPRAATAADNGGQPFEITFRLSSAAVPTWVPLNQVRVYRNKALVQDCPVDHDVVTACVDSRVRDEATGEITVVVRTTRASAWNFAVPASTPPSTTIVSGESGATAAKSVNDPSTGEVTFVYLTSRNSSFSCRLRRTSPSVETVSNWSGCGGPAVLSASKVYQPFTWPDGVYVFEVQATAAGDGTVGPIARRDFVVDRTKPDVTITSGPAATINVTTATFTFISDEDGTTFRCQIDLGAWQMCNGGTVTYTGLSAGTHNFVVEGIDLAGNWTPKVASFTVATGAGGAPGAPGVPVTPAPDDDEDEDEDDTTRPPRGRFARVAGTGRADTAAQLAMRYFEPGLDTVYVARDDDFPDALTATPLATRNGAPILLVSHEGVPAATATALRFLQPGRIVILGGTAAVTPQVEAALGEFAAAVERLRGIDRFGTAAEISRRLHPRGARTVLIATGGNFADALSAGAAASVAGAPVLLVGQSHLPPQTAEELRRLGPTRVIVLGGPVAVDPAVVAEIEALLGLAVERIAGPDRYATAALVSAAFFPDAPPAAFIATGQQFADALTVGPVSGKLGSPLLLVHPDELPDSIAAELARMQPPQVVLVGGPQAVSRATEEAIKAARGGTSA